MTDSLHGSLGSFLLSNELEEGGSDSLRAR